MIAGILQSTLPVFAVNRRISPLFFAGILQLASFFSAPWPRHFSWSRCRKASRWPILAVNGLPGCARLGALLGHRHRCRPPPPTMMATSRPPRSQRSLISTSGVLPWPAASNAVRSSWRVRLQLRQTPCTGWMPRLERTVGSMAWSTCGTAPRSRPSSARGSLEADLQIWPTGRRLARRATRHQPGGITTGNAPRAP